MIVPTIKKKADPSDFYSKNYKSPKIKLKDPGSWTWGILNPQYDFGDGRCEG